MRFVLCSILLLAALFPSCRRQTSDRVIARVGDAELTLEEARAHIDTTRTALEYALGDYVSYWVNTELLYQEAKRKGVESSGEFTRQLEDVRRQLASQTFLERYVYADTSDVRSEEHTSELQSLAY